MVTRQASCVARTKQSTGKLALANGSSRPRAVALHDRGAITILRRAKARISRFALIRAPSLASLTPSPQDIAGWVERQRNPSSAARGTMGFAFGSTHSASPSALPAQPLGGQFVDIVLPVGCVIAAELAQVVPAVDAGRVHVVEHEAHRVVADRLHLQHLDVAFARNRLALLRRVPLDLRARALDAKIFGGERKRLAAVEGDGQRLTVLVQPDLGRPRRGRAHILRGHRLASPFPLGPNTLHKEVGETKNQCPTGAANRPGGRRSRVWSSSAPRRCTPPR